MSTTCDDPGYIYGSSRLTYDGEADDTVGVGHVPAPTAPVSTPAPSASVAARPRAATVDAGTEPAPRPR